MSTAARLSATFPYVSPIARAWWPGRSDIAHIADGGYFDNFGVFTLVEWVDMVANKYWDNLSAKRILIIEIGSSSYVSKPLPENPRGWLYSTIGPLLTIAKVRTATQTARNHVEIKLLEDKWRHHIPIKSFIFELPDEGPLSWKLTKSEIEEIHSHWVTERASAKLDEMRQWFNTVDN